MMSKNEEALDLLERAISQGTQYKIKAKKLKLFEKLSNDARFKKPTRRHHRKHRPAHRPQQGRLIPRRLANKMQKRLMFRRGPLRAQTRRHRLHRLAVPRQEQARAISPKRRRPVGTSIAFAFCRPIAVGRDGLAAGGARGGASCDDATPAARSLDRG